MGFNARMLRPAGCSILLSFSVANFGLGYLIYIFLQSQNSALMTLVSLSLAAAFLALNVAPWVVFRQYFGAIVKWQGISAVSIYLMVCEGIWALSFLSFIFGHWPHDILLHKGLLQGPGGIFLGWRLLKSPDPLGGMQKKLGYGAMVWGLFGFISPAFAKGMVLALSHSLASEVTCGLLAEFLSPLLMFAARFAGIIFALIMAVFFFKAASNQAAPGHNPRQAIISTTGNQS